MGCTMSASAISLAADREATFDAAHRAVALAEKFGLLPWRASSLVLVGWATATGSGVADAVRLIDAEIADATAVGPLPQYYLGVAAEVLLAAGRPADGLAHLDRAIALIDQPGIGFYLPEIYRLRGAVLAGARPRQQAGGAVASGDRRRDRPAPGRHHPGAPRAGLVVRTGDGTCVTSGIQQVDQRVSFNKKEEKP